MKKENPDKFQFGKVKLGGKDIPLTKEGIPNSVYLKSELKIEMREYKEKRKKEKVAVNKKELLEILKKIQ